MVGACVALLGFSALLVHLHSLVDKVALSNPAAPEQPVVLAADTLAFRQLLERAKAAQHSHGTGWPNEAEFASERRRIRTLLHQHANLTVAPHTRAALRQRSNVRCSTGRPREYVRLVQVVEGPARGQTGWLCEDHLQYLLVMP